MLRRIRSYVRRMFEPSALTGNLLTDARHRFPATVCGTLQFIGADGLALDRSIRFVLSVATDTDHADATATTRYAATAIAARYSADGHPCQVEVQPGFVGAT